MRPSSRYTLMRVRSSVPLLSSRSPRIPPRPRSALALDPVGHVEGEAHGGHGLQRGHAGLQGPVCGGLQALLAFPQHLSDAHHGEPAPAFHAVWAPQGLRGATAGSWRWGTHALFLRGAVLFFVSKGDQSGMQRSVQGGQASGQQGRGECPLPGTPAAQAPRRAENPIVMRRGQWLRVVLAIHGLEGAYHIQHQGVFLGGQARDPRALLRGLWSLDNPGGPGRGDGDELHGRRSHTIGV